jgi:hypothetical protein
MTRKLTLADMDIRQLRQDARRLETVAKHLRAKARDLGREQKLTKAAATFFSKRSQIDPSIVLTPEPAQDLEDLMG